MGPWQEVGEMTFMRGRGGECCWLVLVVEMGSWVLADGLVVREIDVFGWDTDARVVGGGLVRMVALIEGLKVSLLVVTPGERLFKGS